MPVLVPSHSQSSADFCRSETAGFVPVTREHGQHFLIFHVFPFAGISVFLFSNLFTYIGLIYHSQKKKEKYTRERKGRFSRPPQWSDNARRSIALFVCSQLNDTDQPKHSSLNIIKDLLPLDDCCGMWSMFPDYLQEPVFERGKILRPF